MAALVPPLAHRADAAVTPARHASCLACAVVLAAVPLAPGVAAQPGPVAGPAAPSATLWHGVVTSVFDGDSLRVRVDGERQTRRVRLDGIDAPEICQPDGQAARDALRRQLQGQSVTVEVRAFDGYQRALATVRRNRDGLDAGRWMVAQGWAWSPGFRWHPGRYADEQRQAQAQALGLFRHANAPPQPPADFRRQHGPCEAPA